MQATINGNTLEVVIIGADNLVEFQPLTLREAQTLAALDNTLQANPAFQKTYPKARLVWVDSMRGLPENGAGRYYLRYEYQNGLTEFWGGLGHKEMIDLENGLITIPEANLGQASTKAE